MSQYASYEMTRTFLSTSVSKICVSYFSNFIKEVKIFWLVANFCAVFMLLSQLCSSREFASYRKYFEEGKCSDLKFNIWKK